MATAIFSPYKANEGVVTYPRDASFSSYLDTTERDFVRTLTKSINNSPSPTRETSSPRISSVGRNLSRVQRSGESDVFRAERYFNEKISDKKGGRSHVVQKRDNGHPHRREKIRDDFLQRKSSRSNISSSVKSPTPSLKSEVSFNSQIGFLLLPKKGSVGHKIFSGFQCKGSCLSKKSVYTHQQMVQSSSPKLYQGNGNRNGNENRKSRLSDQDQEHFAFPIIDTTTLHLNRSRKSMEVFGSIHHQLGKEEIEQNLERKLSILAWDAIPTSPTTTTSCTPPFTISLAKKTSQDDEDVCCSDASSDLFEIETLSGVPGSPTSTPYAPSEGSIEWSVVTASAVDNFSTFSDEHEFTFPREWERERERERSKNNTMEKRKMQIRSSNSGSGMFLGCTSHKALDVVRNYNQHD
ncbi:hypothetical protein SOVF_052340 [Spinacia oleracea]|nr:hypothetical protein SOVF_052340 [Spinacia oleracea]